MIGDDFFDEDEDDGNRGVRALSYFESTFEKLQTPFNEPPLNEATVEDLEAQLLKHEKQAETAKGKIEKVGDELEVKRDMKKQEDRIRAEQERLDGEKGEMRKKAEEKLKKRKRKLAEDSDDEDVKVEVKKERK